MLKPASDHTASTASSVGSLKEIVVSGARQDEALGVVAGAFERINGRVPGSRVSPGFAAQAASAVDVATGAQKITVAGFTVDRSMVAGVTGQSFGAVAL